VEKYSGPEPNGGPVAGGGRHAFVAGLFHPNDVVKTPADKELLQCLQEVIGMKWSDKMERVGGKYSTVGEGRETAKPESKSEGRRGRCGGWVSNTELLGREGRVKLRYV
jgi:hypothetical protein